LGKGSSGYLKNANNSMKELMQNMEETPSASANVSKIILKIFMRML
jgi:hypothetical protein